MSVLNIVRIIVYRFHEKGLEIFLLNNEMESDPKVWKLPEGKLHNLHMVDQNNSINLEPIEDNNKRIINTVAIEGEWHDIPSIKGMVQHDINRIKTKIIEVAPDTEKGGFFVVKEAFKRLMPDEYKAVKELKNILADRNLIRNI